MTISVMTAHGFDATAEFSSAVASCEGELHDCPRPTVTFSIMDRPDERQS